MPSPPIEDLVQDEREVFIPYVWLHTYSPQGVLHLAAPGAHEEPLCSQHKPEGKRRLVPKSCVTLRGRYKGPSTGRRTCNGCFKKLSPTQKREVQDLLPPSQLPG